MNNIIISRSPFKNVADTVNTKAILSTLWIFATLNYLYCDVEGLMDAKLLKKFIAGEINGMNITQGFLLAGAVLMEIPISMVFLSRVIAPVSNRRANVTAGTVMTLVQVVSLTAGTPTLYYGFFSIVEIATTTFIVFYASLVFRKRSQ